MAASASQTPGATAFTGAASDVRLVLDLADDLLEHVLQGHERRSCPPNSSTTTARCVRRRCISLSSREIFIPSGTKKAGFR